MDGWIDFNKNGQKDVYEDPKATIDERLDDLIDQMSMEEKTMQLVTLYGYGRVAKDELPTQEWKSALWADGLANIDEASNGVHEASKYKYPHNSHTWALNKIQSFFVEETRLGIPVEFTNEGIRGLNHYKATSFPAQIGMGATWHPELLYRTGQVIGKEGFALGYHNIYSPVLDVARDQRWGRIVESFGEDPYLVSRLGLEVSKGIQESGLANTLKHFAVYSAPKGGRDGHVRLDPHISWRDMHHMYMAPFKYVIEQSDVLGVMSSYNDYDGVPVTGSYYFLTELLRKAYGFKGYVVSDSDALAYLYTKHHVAETYKEAVRQAINAGLNVRTTFNEPENFIAPLRELVREGLISEETLDARVRDVLYVKFREGLFDQPYRNENGVNETVGHVEHKALALQASRESLILLKNKDNLLPLDPNRLDQVLVCGPMAKNTSSSISRYGALGTDVITMYQGVANHLGRQAKVVYSKGIDLKDRNWPDSEVYDIGLDEAEKRQIDSAVTLAKASDVVIICLGEDESMVGENLTRTDLDLPGHQKELLMALVETGKPIVVVLLNGHPLTINYASRHAGAILEAWFPGQYGGQAVAEVLFGDYNPGGRLPVTMLRSVGQIPYNFPFKPDSQLGQAQEGPNGTGNSRVVNELYPFGYGLSYTQFEFSDLKLENNLSTREGQLEVRFKVKNIGARSGDVVPQLYINDEVSSVTIYEWQLRGFDRINLAAGEEQEVLFIVESEDLALINRKKEWETEAGTFNLIIGASSKDIRLRSTFNIAE